MNNLTSELVFYVLAAIALVSAFLVIVKSNPVSSAICLIISFACAAGVMFQLDAQFLGIIQILVYTGAIMVLILFVVMLLNLGDEPRSFRRPLPTICGLVIAALFMAQLTGVIYSIPGAKESCENCGEGCNIGDALSELKVTSRSEASDDELVEVVISESRIEKPITASNLANMVPTIGHSPAINIPAIALTQIADSESGNIANSMQNGNFPDTKLLGYRLFSKYNTELVIAGLALLIGTIGSVVFSRNVKNQ